MSEYLNCPHNSQGVVCYRCDADDMANTLRKAKVAYYTGEPLVTDVVFDWLEKKLKLLNEKHEYFQEVGYKNGT